MRNVVVTGGASGIGKATVELGRSRGWKVISLDLRNADVNADLSIRADRKQAVSSIAEFTAGSGLDAVIACAGLSARGSPPATAELIVRVNYFGTTELLTSLLPILNKHGTSRAVAFSSTAALHYPAEREDLVQIFLSGDEERAVAATGHDGAFAYAATKIALSRWIKREAVRNAWAGSGILLNAVAPGATNTPMIASLLASEEGRALLSNVTPTPLGGPAEPGDVAEVVCFLASSENRVITGQTIFCDGGAEASLRPTRI